MKKHARVLLLFMLVLSRSMSAQPAHDWDRTYGSWNWEELHVGIRTPDGGLLLGGNTTASGQDVGSPHYGLKDIWLLKLNANGQKLWEKTYGGIANDDLWDILPLPTGDFLLGGTSTSGSMSGTKTSPHYGKEDFWLLRVNAEGNVIWEKTYGGSGRDELFKLVPFPDFSSFLLAGWTNSPADGTKTSDSLGVYDVWVVCVDEHGKEKWQALYGGTHFDNCYDAVATPDGGFLLGGASASPKSATKSQDGRGYSDYWVIKIDSTGKRIWDARYGGSDVDQLEQILPLSDGHYLLAGSSRSFPGGDKKAPIHGIFDAWLVKINPAGQKIWDKSYGGESFDGAYQVIETPKKTIFVGGTSASKPSGTKQSQGYGLYDYWLIHLDSDGNLIWEKSYGGAQADAMTVLLQSPEDGSLWLAGHSSSLKNNYKSENTRGYNDFWILKTQCSISFSLPADTVFCSGTPYELSLFPKNCAGNHCTVEWSNRLVGNKITISTENAGWLAAEAHDKNGCLFRDTMFYETIPGVIVDMPRDTTIFETLAQLQLHAIKNPADTPPYRYLWSNGSTAPYITVNESGRYSVTVTHAENGCTAVGAIEVCACAKRNVFIPNVFHPDDDVFNDIWYIHSKPGAVEIIERLQIFDRMGHRVFEAKNIQTNDRWAGWNGQSNGQRCQPGVYVYVVEIRYPGQKREVIYGDVTLIR